MINSCKSTKDINSFQFVSIPAPRDVFRRYGERLSSRGEFTCSSDSASMPAIVSAGSTIDQIINAERMLSVESLDTKNV